VGLVVIWAVQGNQLEELLLPDPKDRLNFLPANATGSRAEIEYARPALAAHDRGDRNSSSAA
jgi:hypothetical protein